MKKNVDVYHSKVSRNICIKFYFKHSEIYDYYKKREHGEVENEYDKNAFVRLCRAIVKLNELLNL